MASPEQITKMRSASVDLAPIVATLLSRGAALAYLQFGQDRGLAGICIYATVAGTIEHAEQTSRWVVQEAAARGHELIGGVDLSRTTKKKQKADEWSLYFSYFVHPAQQTTPTKVALQ